MRMKTGSFKHFRLMPAWSCGLTACQSTLDVLLERVFMFIFSQKNSLHVLCDYWVM